MTPPLTCPTKLSRSPQRPPAEASGRVPVWRIGVLGGLVGMLCCVGPSALALLGIVSAGTAFAWATALYGNRDDLGGLA